MINSTTAIHFLNAKKIITQIKYNKIFKIWEIYDNKGFLSSDYKLLRALDKSIGIYCYIDSHLENNNPDEYYVTSEDGDTLTKYSLCKKIIDFIEGQKCDLWLNGQIWNLGSFQEKNIIYSTNNLFKII